MYSLKDNSKNILLKKRINNPCENFAVAEVVKAVLQSTNCLIKKVSPSA